MERLRALHQSNPQHYSHYQLSDMYGISYEAVKRILKSKFRPDTERAVQLDAKAIKLKRERRELHRQANILNSKTLHGSTSTSTSIASSSLLNSNKKKNSVSLHFQTSEHSPTTSLSNDWKWLTQ
ncbi:hypothetical protein HMI56_004920 [Coelomomyces lativittatus]|nr:hypothetical protein HMI56_004920 [Coelomomyces lativittatus]